MKQRILGCATVILLLSALAMCVYGAVTGDTDAVYTKAATVCMECIGLG